MLIISCTIARRDGVNVLIRRRNDNSHMYYSPTRCFVKAVFIHLTNLSDCSLAPTQLVLDCLCFLSIIIL